MNGTLIHAVLDLDAEPVPMPLRVEADAAEGGLVGCQDSNSVRAIPLCRMIERSVPMASSGWSGTGTVAVPASVRRCITT